MSSTVEITVLYFAALREQNKTGLVTFITAGDPSLEATVPVMHALVRAGANIIELGVPFTDPSGDRLRDWMGVDYRTFYGDPRIGVAAQAFCYPGTAAKGGDHPPPPRCAALWRPRLLAALPRMELTLLVGGYAQAWALGARAKANMTETVRAWRDYGPDILPLPHPSWRNTAWLRRNPWFETELLPVLRARVAALLAAANAVWIAALLPETMPGARRRARAGGDRCAVAGGR